MKKSKKVVVLLTSYILTAFVIMGGFILSNYTRAENYKRYLNNTYQHAFAELVTTIGEMDSALQKSLYASSPSMVSSSCTEVFGKALSAQMAMGELPFSELGLESTASFISSAGDYALMLSKSAAAGKVCSDEQFKNLQALSNAASVISGNLTDLYAQIQDGRLTIGELSYAETAAGKSDKSVSSDLGENFKTMESEFPEIPSLIYDGPFSQHITDMSPVLTENSQEISSNEALEIASEFSGIEKSAFTYGGERDCNLPVYMFYAKVNGGDLTVEVTKKGGFILTMANSRSIGESAVSTDEAVAKASGFLLEKGFDSMRPSYFTVQESSVIVNFAYTQDDVICYTDLIKVRVALDNGDITAFEGHGYVMNHTKRDIPEISISEEDAASGISDHLTILSHNLAIIPSDGKYELFCHEFKCQNESGAHYIIYVNATTGVEEKILILIEDENGTLVL